MTTIKLQSGDQKVFEVELAVARCSVTVRDALGDDGQEVVVPLPEVDSATLQKVIEWATHHKDDPPPDYNDEEDDDISSWDVAFLEVDQDMLFKLMLAANYLDIQGLLDLTRNALRRDFPNSIIGRTPEETLLLLGVENDYTKEEEEQVRKENDWC